MQINNFNEFEGEIIKYSDYISEKAEFKLEDLNNIPVENSWTTDDSQKLSYQMVGVKHPWTREQYEKFTHPVVKKDIDYDTYVRMWNTRVPEEYKVKSVSENWGKLGHSACSTVMYSPATCSVRMYPNTGVTSSYPWNTDYKNQQTKQPSTWTHDPVAKKPIVKVVKKNSAWSSMSMENRIMISFMAIASVISFMTMLILMLK